jgi:hypothetical protein
MLTCLLNLPKKEKKKRKRKKSFILFKATRVKEFARRAGVDGGVTFFYLN